MRRIFELFPPVSVYLVHWSSVQHTNHICDLYCVCLWRLSAWCYQLTK